MVVQIRSWPHLLYKSRSDGGQGVPCMLMGRRKSIRPRASRSQSGLRATLACSQTALRALASEGWASVRLHKEVGLKPASNQLNPQSAHLGKAWVPRERALMQPGLPSQKVNKLHNLAACIRGKWWN
eukprot:353493-Chlamydomonas_euryale.AAC.6